MREIQLSSQKYPGLAALVDDEDYALVTPYRWWPYKSPRSKTFYVQGRLRGDAYSPRIYLHRLILPVLGEVDHRNGNGLDCQKHNLRPATRRQQNRNTAMAAGSTQKPRYKGVKACTNNGPNPWRASIYVDGKHLHLGVFSDPEDAARAYDNAALEAYGEFARVNFPEGS